MSQEDATFAAALYGLSDTCIEMEDFRGQKRMGIGVQDLEVGAEGIVGKAAVLREHQIPSNIDEYPT
jgi:hypothetical protein